MQSFQEALERGEAEHLLPVFNAKQKVARGELREEDIPYMQRGEFFCFGGAAMACYSNIVLMLSRLMV